MCISFVCTALLPQFIYSFLQGRRQARASAMANGYVFELKSFRAENNFLQARLPMYRSPNTCNKSLGCCWFRRSWVIWRMSSRLQVDWCSYAIRRGYDVSERTGQLACAPCVGRRYQPLPFKSQVCTVCCQCCLQAACGRCAAISADPQ